VKAFAFTLLFLHFNTCQEERQRFDVIGTTMNEPEETLVDKKRTKKAQKGATLLSTVAE
jgi:hypothetical protein